MAKLLTFCVLVLLCLSAFALDLDGDGFDSDPAVGRFRDCCDSVDDGCYDPYMVNPGAWEIPNNGVADRCDESYFQFDNTANSVSTTPQYVSNLPCDDAKMRQSGRVDYRNANFIVDSLIGPNRAPIDTEAAAIAMDLCEFKDDDDDPSWGFARQENVVFALADDTRNGYDINIIGPDQAQAAVLQNFGRITPANGRYMLAMSTGSASTAQQRGSAVTYPLTTLNTPVAPLPGTINGAPGDSDAANGCPFNRGSTAFDSILSRFAVVQPTNMNAFSLKVAMLDSKRNPGAFNYLGTGSCPINILSYLMVTKNGTVGVPGNKNIAQDINRRTLSTYNPFENFFTICSEHVPNKPANRANTCPLPGSYFLDGTQYFTQNGPLATPEYATQWIPVGTSATPREPYLLRVGVWDYATGLPDTTVFVDDFMPISEARTFMQPYGYQYTADVEISSLNVTFLNSTSVTLRFEIKNNGPEIAGDPTIAFTPPKGTSFNSMAFNGRTLPTIFAAAAPYTNNSYHKLNGVSPISVGGAFTGTVTFNILADAPRDLTFRLTATTSSIEKVFANNFEVQIVYNDRPFA